MTLELPVVKLKKECPQACLKEDRLTTEKIVHNIFDTQLLKKSFSLLVKGTDFQIKVWQELISIPTDTTTSYANVAYITGNSKAIRATANAISYLLLDTLSSCYS